jgi:hypothetical protein
MESTEVVNVAELQAEVTDLRLQNELYQRELDKVNKTKEVYDGYKRKYYLVIFLGFVLASVVVYMLMLSTKMYNYDLLNGVWVDSVTGENVIGITAYKVVTYDENGEIVQVNYKRISENCIIVKIKGVEQKLVYDYNNQILVVGTNRILVRK